jgi:hypothetical protein
MSQYEIRLAELSPARVVCIQELPHQDLREIRGERNFGQVIPKAEQLKSCGSEILIQFACADSTYIVFV